MRMADGLASRNVVRKAPKLVSSSSGGVTSGTFRKPADAIRDTFPFCNGDAHPARVCLAGSHAACCATALLRARAIALQQHFLMSDHRRPDRRFHRHFVIEIKHDLGELLRVVRIAEAEHRFEICGVEHHAAQRVIRFPELGKVLMREDGSESKFAGFCEQIRDIAGEVPLAFIHVEKERRLRACSSFRVEEKRADEKPTEKVARRLLHLLDAAEVDENDVPFGEDFVESSVCVVWPRMARIVGVESSSLKRF